MCVEVFIEAIDPEDKAAANSLMRATLGKISGTMKGDAKFGETALKRAFVYEPFGTHFDGKNVSFPGGGYVLDQFRILIFLFSTPILHVDIIRTC